MYETFLDSLILLGVVWPLVLGVMLYVKQYTCYCITSCLMGSTSSTVGCFVCDTKSTTLGSTMVATRR